MYILLKILPYIIIKILTLNKCHIYRNSLFKDYYYPLNIYPIPSICHIIDNIYIGNIYDSANYIKLKELDIKFIINISLIIPNFFYNKINYLNINIQDDGNDDFKEHYFSKIIKFIKRSQKYNKNLLIHCFAGKSRSVTPIIYYLMKEYNLTILQSIFFIKNKRNMINPSIKFINDIKNVAEYKY